MPGSLALSGSGRHWPGVEVETTVRPQRGQALVRQDAETNTVLE